MKDPNADRPGYREARIGWVPASWDERTLSQVGTFCKGRGIPNESKRPTGLPCITYGDIYTKYSEVTSSFASFVDDSTALRSQEIRQDALLFASSGETLDEIGKCVAYVGPSPAYAGGDIIVFSAPEHNSSYLSYLLNSDYIVRYRRRLGQGNSVVHIYADGLSSLTVVLPPPPEQEKIAAILSTWDDAIETTRDLISAKKQQKKVLMQQLLTGKRRLTGFTADWLSLLYSDLFKRIVRPTALEPTTRYRLVSIRRRGGGLFDRAHSLPSEIAYAELNSLRAGDFIVSKRQATHGAITVVTPRFSGAYVSNEYTIFERLPGSDLSMGFFVWLTQDRHMWHQAYVSSNGVHIEKLIFDPKHFLRQRIRIPPTSDEQRAIAQVLDAAEAEVKSLEEKFAALQKQKKGLMQKLLTGQVRVKG